MARCRDARRRPSCPQTAGPGRRAGSLVGKEQPRAHDPRTHRQPRRPPLPHPRGAGHPVRRDPRVHRRRRDRHRWPPGLQPGRGGADPGPPPDLRLPPRRPAVGHRPPGLRAQAGDRTARRPSPSSARPTGSPAIPTGPSPSTTGWRTATPRPSSATPTGWPVPSSSRAASAGWWPWSATGPSPAGWPTRPSTTSATPARRWSSCSTTTAAPTPPPCPGSHSA